MASVRGTGGVPLVRVGSCLFALWVAACLLGADAAIFRTDGDAMIKVGVVYDEGNKGDVGTLLGYEAFFIAAGASEMFNGGMDVGGFRFGFELNATHVEEDCAERRRVLRSMVEDYGAHFLLGLAKGQGDCLSDAAGEAERLMLHCCETNSSVFRKNVESFYGMTGPYEDQFQTFVDLLPIKMIRNVSVIYREDMPQQLQICSNAMASLNRIGDGVNGVEVRDMAINETQATSPEAMQDIAQRLMNHGTEILIGCLDQSDTSSLLHSYAKLDFPLGAGAFKGLYFTKGPSSPGFIEQTEEDSKYVFSTIPWHYTANFTDNGELFGTTRQYQQLMESSFAIDEPSWRMTAASVSLFTLAKTIEVAFEGCDVSQTQGDPDELFFGIDVNSCEENKSRTGYNRIRKTIQFIDIDTIYGRVYFNKWRRNTKNEPLLTQVLPDDDGTLTPRVVLPIRAAILEEALLTLPTPNRFKPNPCPAGSFGDQEDFGPCELCPAGSFNDKPGRQDCQDCEVGFYNALENQTACLPCPENTNTTRKKSTNLLECVCKPTFYHPEGKPGEACTKCPVGGNCSGGGNLPFPQDGFWGDIEYPFEMYACEPPAACTGGPDFSCAPEYTDRRCDDCREGHYLAVEQCWPCPSSNAVVWLELIFVYALWLLINKIVSDRVETVEMVLNWAQLANVVGSLPLGWPTSIEQFFGIASFLDFDVDIVEPSCLGDWSFTHNFIVQLMLPASLSLIGFAWFFFKYMWFVCAAKKDSCRLEGHGASLSIWRKIRYYVNIPETPEEVDIQWDRSFAWVLAALDVTYITITRYSFDVLKCVNIGGVMVMNASVSIECDSDQYKLLRGLAAVGLTVYTFGYLALVIWKLTQMQLKRTFSATKNLHRYGFLYGRFELEFYWSGIAGLVLRILFVAVSVFSNQPLNAAALLSLFLIMSILLHVYTLPFISDQLDVLQGFMLSSLLALIVGGILFSNPIFNQRKEMEIFVFFVLAAMWAAIVVIFSAEIIAKTQQWWIKKLHRKSVMFNAPYDPDNVQKRAAQKSMAVELYSTFDSQFLFNWLRKASRSTLLEWDVLSRKLQPYMADDAYASHLSLELVAQFWRKLVNGFPELIDFLAMADEPSRAHFTNFIERLYKDFYLQKNMDINLFNHVCWQDRGALAQWLTMASPADRSFFAEMMCKAFRSVHGDQVAHTVFSRADGKSGSRDFDRSSSPSGPFAKTSSGRLITASAILTRATSLAAREIEEGRGPLYHVANATVAAIDEGEASDGGA